eukprot:2233720-Pyramimonas_sp.AAC.1
MSVVSSFSLSAPFDLQGVFDQTMMWEVVFWDINLTHERIGMFLPDRFDCILRDGTIHCIWDPRKTKKDRGANNISSWAALADESESDRADDHVFHSLSDDDPELRRDIGIQLFGADFYASDASSSLFLPTPDASEGSGDEDPSLPPGPLVEPAPAGPPLPPPVEPPPPPPAPPAGGSYFQLRIGALDVQRAPSKRSKCTVCGEFIPLRGLRLEVSIAVRKPACYRHVGCSTYDNTPYQEGSHRIISDARLRDVWTDEELAEIDACLARLQGPP